MAILTGIEELPQSKVDILPESVADIGGQIADPFTEVPFSYGSPKSPKSPKSLKKRQESRKAKYDRWKCTGCRKPLKTKSRPLSKKVIMQVKETFKKYSRATWKKVEQQLLKHGGGDSDGSKEHEDPRGVIDDHYPTRPNVTKSLHPYKTPLELREGLREHFSELLYPGALHRGESVQIPWTSMGQWLENNQKRFVNWPTGVKFPDSTYQMVGFWNLTEVSALYGVKIENWSDGERNVAMPTTPLVFNQMGNTVVTISQVAELAYGPSSAESSSDFFSDSDTQAKRRWNKRANQSKRFVIPHHHAKRISSDMFMSK